MNTASLDHFLQSLRDDSAPDKVPSYEGTDPHIHEEPWCTACHSKPLSRLLCCSRCHVAWYCDSKCQKNHYDSGHKEICVSLARTMKRVEKLTTYLRCARLTDFGYGEEPEDFFETQAGCFGQQEETLPYMEARLNLVQTYWHAAYEAGYKPVWEKTLFHALELQRLGAVSPLNIRYMTPFILLNVSRDDDAFDFIRFWMNTDDTDDNTMIQLTISYAGSQEGDWMYPREKNCRFLDVFKQCANVTKRRAPLPYVVALLVIKLRIVATYDATCNSIDLAFGTTGGKRIQEVQIPVKEMLIDERFVNVESQRQQVDRLVNVIHQRNPLILPSILNPEPLLTNNKSNRKQVAIRGAPAEALFAHLYCARCLIRVPGAKEMLEQRFGKKPSYDL